MAPREESREGQSTGPRAAAAPRSVRNDVSRRRGHRTLGGGPRRVGVRTRLRYEDRLPVITQLRDRVDDVGERAVPARLDRRIEVGLRIPAAGELLDARD